MSEKLTARARAKERRQHQLSLLEGLKARTYEDLLDLPERTVLDDAPHLPGISFKLARSDGANGGVKIEVIASERSLLIFEHRFALGFEMLPDGKVIPLHTVSDDD